MKNCTFCLLFVFFSVSALFSQSNEFKIGMFGFDWKSQMGLPVTQVTYAGYNSSSLNVLGEDGFNIVQLYAPDWWTSENTMENVVALTKANGFEILVNAMHYYWPGHANEYTNSTGARPNYFSFIDNVYSNQSLKNTVWGHQITEEASYLHGFNPSNVPICGFSFSCSPNPLVEFELPPNNVNSAISDFKLKLNNSGLGFQKLVVMEAAHGQVINDNFSTALYNPQDYLNIPNKPDVFFEGSYKDLSYPYSPENYSNISNGMFHYLGFLKSIDYSQKHVSDVHKVVNLEGAYNHVVHYNPSIPNGNWLWFQSYASIIHGVNGIWFWQLPSSYKPCEKAQILGVSCSLPQSEINDLWSSLDPRFHRDYFADYYKNFTAPLAKELRYLVNKNILSTDPNSVVCSKTDEEDLYKVLLSSKNYLPLGFRTDNYDLRYTIRTNGTETVMIIANPLPYSLSNVLLDFSNVPNPDVRNSNGVDVLFSNQSNFNSTTYKTNRKGSVNLLSNTVSKKYFRNISACSKKLNLSFSPFDVHVLKFHTVDLTGWKEHATTGFHSVPYSDLTVDFNDDERRIFYVGHDGVIRNTFKTENSWSNSWFPFPDFPKAKTSSGLVWNDSHEELFYVATNNRICRIYWNGSSWQYEYTAGYSASSNSDVVVDQYDKVYYIGSDRIIRSTYRTGNSWSNTWFPNFPRAKSGSGLNWNASNNELFYVAENGTVCRIFWSGNSWQYEYTAGFSAMFNSDLAVDQYNKLYYIGSDGILRYTYKSGGSWTNSWFPQFPKAKFGSGLQWNASRNELFYVGLDNKIYSIYYDGGWDYKVISNNCDELAQFKLSFYNDHLCFVGQDLTVHEYTKYPDFGKKKTEYSREESKFQFDSEVGRKFFVFPNPTTGEVFFAGIDGSVSVEVFDLMGRLVLKNDEVLSSIDLSGNQKGIYLLKITDKSGEILKRRVCLE